MRKSAFLTMALLTVSVMASAQFMNGGSRHPFNRDGSDKFSTVSVAFTPATMRASYDNLSVSEGFVGFNVMWNQAKIVSEKLPIYFGYGLGLGYLSDTENTNYEGAKATETIKFFNARIPVELLYRFNVSGTDIDVAPVIGLDALFHFSGKDTYKYSYQGKSITDETNYFDKKGSRRFNIDWHIGAKAFYKNRFYLGLTYEGPVLKLQSSDEMTSTISMVNIAVGLQF